VENLHGPASLKVVANSELLQQHWGIPGFHNTNNILDNSQLLKSAVTLACRITFDVFQKHLLRVP
jgi:hypothetical protein